MNKYQLDNWCNHLRIALQNAEEVTSRQDHELGVDDLTEQQLNKVLFHSQEAMAITKIAVRFQELMKRPEPLPGANPKAYNNFPPSITQEDLQQWLDEHRSK